jgi:hypothetical protein
VHAELVLGRGITVGHNAIAMLMQRAGIAGRSGARKRYGISSVAMCSSLPGVHRARPPVRTRIVDGSVGDCYDNAMVEAFWSRTQVELLDTRRWKTRV